MKICKRCNESKSLLEFSKHFGFKDGRRTVCKQCVKQDYQNNREEILKKQKDYYEKNKEKRAAYCKNWNYNNLQPLWAKENLSKGAS